MPSPIASAAVRASKCMTKRGVTIGVIKCKSPLRSSRVPGIDGRCAPPTSISTNLNSQSSERADILLDAWRVQRNQWLEWVDRFEEVVQLASRSDSEVAHQSCVDDIWFSLNRRLEFFLQLRAREAQNQGVEMLYHGKPQRRKGTAPVLRKVSRVVHRPLQSNATNSIRVWMRLAGRLAELERQEMHEGLEAESVRNLRRRIRRSSPYVEGMTAAEAAEKVTELVRQDHFQKIQAWRDRLQEDNKEVFRWVRAVPSSPCLNLFDDELDQADPASDDSQGALGKLQTL